MHGIIHRMNGLCFWILRYIVILHFRLDPIYFDDSE